MTDINDIFYQILRIYLLMRLSRGDENIVFKIILKNIYFMIRKDYITKESSIISVIQNSIHWPSASPPPCPDQPSAKCRTLQTESIYKM